VQVDDLVVSVDDLVADDVQPGHGRAARRRLRALGQRGRQTEQRGERTGKRYVEQVPHFIFPLCSQARPLAAARSTQAVSVPGHS
jgi:hypothetical protein